MAVQGAGERLLEVADNAEVGCIPGERVLRSLELPVAIPGAGSLLRADTESVPA
ncbi:hypothetical protein [Skermania piniformis]|uniref:Uncharacterized protein n=1 Tax=Skermania pinensis TaxID=39122 RepID=A0ABX8SDS6_9ACTN|nr:hypothetical protein [Skermania piniformis]QXQ16090.1 hypothetical protein KV203_16655 [Skermania piniformis]